jgi:hypothetical protein
MNGLKKYCEDGTHAFVIRVWLEQTVAEDGEAIWRGVIIHVPSGRRRYFQSLDEVRGFVVPYLDGVNPKLGLE